MNGPEWNALLIAVGAGLAFWAAIELLLRCSAARRVRATRDSNAQAPADGTGTDRQD